MAYTAMDVFERAMYLSDNGDESTGEFDTLDNREYKYRTVAILNTFINEVYPYSDTCVLIPGKRPVHPFLKSMDDELDLDYNCIEVLSYGLGAKLFTDENAVLANFYQQEYERRLAELKHDGIARPTEAIEDVYSGSWRDGDGTIHYNTGWYPHNDFGRW